LPGFRDNLIDRSLVDRADHLVGVAAFGQQHPNRFRVRNANLAEELDAGHVGQHLVAQHQVDLFNFEHIGRGLPRAGRQHPVVVN